MEIVALAVSILFNAVSLILMKSFALSLDKNDHILQTLPRWRRIRSLVWDARVFLSIVCFGLAGVTWMYALTDIDLSIAYPAVSATYVGIALTGKALFGEHLTAKRWMGIALVSVGIVVLFVS